MHIVHFVCILHLCIKPTKYAVDKIVINAFIGTAGFSTNSLFCPSGTYCNSASACFVASDGKNLRLYQAVVDARKLLDELSDPETSVSGHTHSSLQRKKKIM